MIKLGLKCFFDVEDLTAVVPKAVSKPLPFLFQVWVYMKLLTDALTTMIRQTPRIDKHNIFLPSHKDTVLKLNGKRRPVDAIMPLNVVKAAAKGSNSSFTAVLLEGVTGGIRNYLLSRNKEVPDTIDVIMPVPWPGHDIN